MERQKLQFNMIILTKLCFGKEKYTKQNLTSAKRMILHQADVSKFEGFAVFLFSVIIYATGVLNKNGALCSFKTIMMVSLAFPSRLQWLAWLTLHCWLQTGNPEDI